MQNERSGQIKNVYSHANTWFRTQLVLWCDRCIGYYSSKPV